METSIFSDKFNMPDDLKLGMALGSVFDLWIEIRDYVIQFYPKAIEEWNFPGQKYGWSFRMKDKKLVDIKLSF